MLRIAARLGFFLRTGFFPSILRASNERIEVIGVEDYDRDHSDFNDMINRVWEIKQKHNVDNNNLTIYVDAANPEIWGSLKRMFNEPYAERYVFDKLIYYRKNNLNPAGPEE